MKGLEPSRIAAPDPKSGVSANFTTSAFKKAKFYILAFKKKQKSYILAFTKKAKSYIFAKKFTLFRKICEILVNFRKKFVNFRPKSQKIA